MSATMEMKGTGELLRWKDVVALIGCGRAYAEKLRDNRVIKPALRSKGTWPKYRRSDVEKLVRGN